MFLVVLLVMFASGERGCRHGQSDDRGQRIYSELLHSKHLFLVDANRFYQPEPQSAAGILPEKPEDYRRTYFSLD